MGTNMHMYAEVQKGGTWHLIGDLEENIEYYPEDNPDAQRYKPAEVYTTRNNNLFGILADVRNPNGRTLNDQKFDVIASPRVLPEDLSPEIQNWLKDWQNDIRSPSWLLLSEILSFDWHGKIMHYEAMVDARTAHLFEANKPFPFNNWPKHVPISCAACMKYGVTVRWTDTYAASVGNDVLEIMQGLKRHGKPSCVRLVFWFSH